MQLDGLLEAAQRFGLLLVELLALFLVVSFVLAIVQRRWIGPARLQRILSGDRRLSALVKGGVLGALTPFCSCAGIPVLASLLRARVRFGTAAAFLLASPLLNPVLLGVVALLFGWRTAVGYALVVFPAAIIAGAIWERLGLDRHLKVASPERALVTTAGVEEETAGCGTEACSTAGISPDWRADARAAWREALETLRPVLLPMLAGVAVGSLLYGLVPEATVARFAGPANPLAVPVAALIGVPLYVRGEAALPIGFALLAAGVGIGPVFAMIIGAAGASIPEVAMLSGLFKRPLLLAFLGSVFAVAVVAGYTIPLLA